MTDPRVSEVPWREGIEQPLVFWVPSIAMSGMAVYTGDRFAAWKKQRVCRQHAHR
jgi:aldose sugar dehydrogenase